MGWVQQNCDCFSFLEDFQTLFKMYKIFLDIRLHGYKLDSLFPNRCWEKGKDRKALRFGKDNEIWKIKTVKISSNEVYSEWVSRTIAAI